MEKQPDPESPNLYEYLGLDVDASTDEIVAHLDEKRKEIDEISEKARSSETKLQDLTCEVAISDITLSIDAEDVKRDEKEILNSADRIGCLVETLPDLKTRCCKILAQLVEGYRSKGARNSLSYICCFGNRCSGCVPLCCEWTTDPDKQDDYVSKIREKLLTYEASGDGNIYDDVSKGDIKEFRRFVAFIARLQKVNSKNTVTFKSDKSISKIENDCEKWKHRKSEHDFLVGKKEVLEDIALKQRERVRKDSLIMNCAEEILLDDNLRPMYKQYLEHPLYHNAPFINREALCKMVELEAIYENSLCNATSKLNDLIDMYKDTIAKNKKIKNGKSDSKYIVLSNKIVTGVEERRQFVIFDPLSTALDEVLSVMENAKDMVYVSCNNKRLLSSKVRLEFAVTLNELDSFCCEVYSHKLSTCPSDIAEDCV